MRRLPDYRPETNSLLSALITAGFALIAYDNGDDKMPLPANRDKAIEELMGADEAHLYVSHPSRPGKVLWLYLVYGNGPGELVADYVCAPALDAVCQAESDKWEGEAQPMESDAPISGQPAPT